MRHTHQLIYRDRHVKTTRDAGARTFTVYPICVANSREKKAAPTAGARARGDDDDPIKRSDDARAA
jgi:hypothetical protein